MGFYSIYHRGILTGHPYSAAVLLVILAFVLAACGGGNDTPTATLPPTQPPTLVPTSTATEAPTATSPVGEASATPLLNLVTATPEGVIQQVVVEAAEGQEIPPPIAVTLPEGWSQFDSTIAFPDIGSVMSVLPYTLYRGPVTGGEGFIIVLWGFSAIAPGSPSSERYFQFNLGVDGRRLLQLAVTDIGCVVGGITDPNYDRRFNIGDQIGVGSYWAAVQCPESEDTRGWFAGLHYLGINYVFYAYTEPITAMDGPAEAELQAILNTVDFLMTDPLVTPTPAGN